MQRKDAGQDKITPRIFANYNNYTYLYMQPIDKIIPVGFSNEEHERLKKLADEKGLKVSTFIRSYLHQTLLKKNTNIKSK